MFQKKIFLDPHLHPFLLGDPFCDFSRIWRNLNFCRNFCIPVEWGGHLAEIFSHIKVCILSYSPPKFDLLTMSRQFFRANENFVIKKSTNFFKKNRASDVLLEKIFFFHFWNYNFIFCPQMKNWKKSKI